MTSSSRSATPWATMRLFSPASISAVPMTTSLPFIDAAPVRSSPPSWTLATLATVTGTPLRTGDDGPADLVDVPDAGIGADEEGLAAALDEVGADRDVGPLERLGELGEGDAIGGEAARDRAGRRTASHSRRCCRRRRGPSTVRSCGRITQSWMVRR